MGKISLLFYCIGQGIKNLKRNRMFTLASIGTITACLFLFGIFYFALSNIQYMISNAETSVGITIFFEENITDEQITKIGDEIKSRSEVKKCTFVSAEEAWEKCKEDMFKGEEDLTSTFEDDNPLEDSASYEVYLKSIEKQNEFVKYVKGLDGVRQVNSANDVLKSFSSINSLIAYASVVIICILIAVAVFLISTSVTMGISIRREEIRIMRLVGASDFFVKAPFIVEGIMIGVIGSGIPLVILFVFYKKIVVYMLNKFNILSEVLTFLSARHIFSSLTPFSFGIGIGIGFIGSYITVRRHLKV